MGTGAKMIIFDVGANDGGHTNKFLAQEGALVYAFEPTIELQNQLQKKFKNNNNFFLIPAAVDIENGFRYFNVAGTKDWGCSSLHEFTDNIDQLWPNRPDFHFTDRYKVLTLRLDTFCVLHNITQIDFLHIDAQGNDFNVLKSLGEKINLVQSGECEAALKVNLYKDTNNDAYEIKKWLEDKGFTVSFEDQHQEVNIIFRRL